MICVNTDTLKKPEILLDKQKTVQQLCDELNIIPCSKHFQTQGLILGWVHNRLSIFTSSNTAINIDFTAGKLYHRFKFGGGRNQHIARAIGIKKDFLPSVIDATAGLASDSFVMASLGCNVTMIEKNTMISILINDALVRGRYSKDNSINKILTNMRLYNEDSTLILPKIYPSDVIYIDPMYPHKKKKAASRKGMQLLQQLVGEDVDSEHILSTALTYARKRVVVKRPKYSNYIQGIIPSTSISSPNTRYDIYII